MKTPTLFFACFLFCLTLSAEESTNAEQKIPAEDEEFFEKKVRPLLVEKCIGCHGPEKQRGGLRLDSREAWLKGTDNGPALVEGDPQTSRVIEALNYEGELKMPPDGKLPDADIEILTEWVKRKAPWPNEKNGGETATHSDPDAWKKHWAFQKVVAPAIPETPGARTAIDQFTLKRLREDGLNFSSQADRPTLVRRLKYDLLGLPPTLEETNRFTGDQSPDAMERLVDEFLASPQFGVRWGRHWLDVARYSDTKGYVFQEDRNYPEAYLFRDWVVDALNRDMPYDQFIKQQIAADQIVPADDAKGLAAMGFLTLGRRFLNNNNDIIDDRIDVVTRGTMGLTVGCARCHAHKYDPIPTEDYYSLYGVFNSSQEPKNAPMTLRMVDAPNPIEPRVFIRGNQHNQGEQVPRQFLLVVAGPDRKPFQKGSGRLEMAEAITSNENPLTSRVLVNRVWSKLFGSGLVKTPSDFGMRSLPPSHPELLDHLSAEFMSDGWSIKRLIRRIVLSQTYQQASDFVPEAAAKDPENRLLWAMNRRRKDFEGWRDGWLAASGSIDLAVGGPGVSISSEPFSNRRTIYGFIDRQNLPSLFRTFDFASPDAHAPLRFQTTVPQQALVQLNSPFALSIAEATVKRPEFSSADTTAEKIRQLYRVVLSREASAEEVALGEEFMANSSTVTEELVSSPWQAGYGKWSEESKKLSDYQKLPFWTGSAWQGGPQLPDNQIGWVMLNSMGGHPGNDHDHAAVRRFTSPRSGKAVIRGMANHPAKEGDGVRLVIISSKKGIMGTWDLTGGDTETHLPKFDLEEGEVIDFVVDCRESPDNDSFQWRSAIRLDLGRGEFREWKSVADFSGPPPKPVGLWEQYTQVLLMSNELMFVD